jgi:hypothetical protein
VGGSPASVALGATAAWPAPVYLKEHLDRAP